MTRFDKIQRSCQAALKAIKLHKIPVRLERGKDLITIGWPEKTGVAITIQPTPAASEWFYISTSKFDENRIQAHQAVDNVFNWKDVSIEAICLLTRMLITQEIERKAKELSDD